MSALYETPTGVPPGTVLVVDDMPENLALMSSLLMDRYRVKVAVSGAKALAIAASDDPPDLILLDVMMPGLDGLEVCRRLKRSSVTADIPVIFLTARADSCDEAQGLAAGAVDYITKPISPPIVQARVATHMMLKAQADLLRSQRRLLHSEVEARTRELHLTQDATILALASLAETRDSETGNHLRRTQRYVLRLAEGLRRHPRDADVLTDDYIALLFKSAPLHDIGKVGVPDDILMKPGPLTPDEFAVMKTHAAIGHAALQRAEQVLGAQVPFLTLAKEIAYHHHERWDGSGYPAGLVGDAIPLSARIMALADVYDALVSRRVYKPALPHPTAVAMIAAERGRHFDPLIVDVFLDIHGELAEIAAALADPHALPAHARSPDAHAR